MMAESEVLKAFMKRYDRVYNPEANDRAILAKEAAAQRQAARQAEIDLLFPAKPRRD